MKITHEVSGSLTLLYIYIRLFNGKTVKTLPGVKCELLYDYDNNWIGINVLKEYFDGENLALPKIKTMMENTEHEKINETDRMIALLFDHTKHVNSFIVESCNVDFNDDGFFGVEIILNKTIGGMNAIKSLLLQH